MNFADNTTRSHECGGLKESQHAFGGPYSLHEVMDAVYEAMVHITEAAKDIEVTICSSWKALWLHKHIYKLIYLYCRI